MGETHLYATTTVLFSIAWTIQALMNGESLMIAGIIFLLSGPVTMCILLALLETIWWIEQY